MNTCQVHGPVDTRRAHGSIIRPIRVARGLRIKDLAAVAGIYPAYLSRIETGTRRPRTAITARLAAALDVPVEVLTGQQPAITTLRGALGIDEAAFAADVGIEPGQLARLEQGAELPSEDLARVMATRLGVDVTALLPHLASVA